MVISLNSSNNYSWEMTFAANDAVIFASASAVHYGSQGVPPRLHVFHTPSEGIEREIDRVSLWEPHSWWTGTGQRFCPLLHLGDKLRLSVDVSVVAVDVRLDLESEPW